MTFGIRNIVGIHRLHTRQKNYSIPLLFKTYEQWSYWQRKAFDYFIWCHLAHALDFSATLLCWLWIFPITFSEANVLIFIFFLHVIQFIFLLNLLKSCNRCISYRIFMLKDRDLLGTPLRICIK
jgi:hypothetical protein